MILNSLACIIVCNELGISKEVIHDLFLNFKNAKRRFAEDRVGDTIIIDDYAHHPTEISVTLDAARQKYPNKQIIAIFKPHTFSRVEEFSDEFASALNLADKAYITDIYTDRPEEGYDDVTYLDVMDKTDNCEHISLEEIDKLLKHKNAVILFMSSKAIYVMKDAYEKLIEEAN